MKTDQLIFPTRTSQIPEVSFRQYPWTIAISTITLVAFLSPSLATSLEFDQQAILSGELWRLITGHLTHWNFNHLFWDLLVFAGCTFYLEQKKYRHLALILLLQAIGISLVILYFSSETTIYRGLSGIDSGLYCLITLLFLKSQKDKSTRWIGYSLIALFIFKLLYEVLAGKALFVTQTISNITITTEAHLAGALISIGIGLFLTAHIYIKTIKQSLTIKQNIK